MRILSSVLLVQMPCMMPCIWLGKEHKLYTTFIMHYGILSALNWEFLDIGKVSSQYEIPCVSFFQMVKMTKMYKRTSTKKEVNVNKSLSLASEY